MKIEKNGQTLYVSSIPELSALFGPSFKDQVRESFSKELKNLDINLSQTAFVDSTGLGALVSLLKDVRERDGHIRLVEPMPRVQQIFELTRMDRIFEIVRAA